MRQLNKKAWPYKTRIEHFDHKEHNEFVERYPAIKTYVIKRNTTWLEWDMPSVTDVYFTKESDLVLYRLSAQ